MIDTLAKSALVSLMHRSQTYDKEITGNQKSIYSVFKITAGQPSVTDHLRVLASKNLKSVVILTDLITVYNIYHLSYIFVFQVSCKNSVSLLRLIALLHDIVIIFCDKISLRIVVSYTSTVV